MHRNIFPSKEKDMLCLNCFYVLCRKIYSMPISYFFHLAKDKSSSVPALGQVLIYPDMQDTDKDNAGLFVCLFLLSWKQNV